MSAEGKILVTGANGFIGGWIVESLYLSGEKNLRAGIHNWSGAVRLARFPIEISLCNILAPNEINQALDGISCVIHCAKGSDESIITGTQNMLGAALKQDVSHFIYISSTEVYGNAEGNIDESFQCAPTGNSYGDSKIKAEELCWKHYAKGLPITVLRPSIVYGPFSKIWTMNVALKLQSGNWGVFKGHGDGNCNLIYVSDLVSAVQCAMENKNAIGQTFNVNGSERLTWNEYFDRFNNTLGLPPLKTIESGRASVRASLLEPIRSFAKLGKEHYEHPIRKFAARFALAKQVMKYVEKTIKTSPRQSDFQLFNRKVVYSTVKAREVLGYESRFKIDDGLRLSVCWLSQVGLFNQPSA